VSDATAKPPAEETGADTAADGAAAEDTPDLETIEVVTAEVEDDGTIIVDDLVAEVDGDGNVVATDELVEIDLPDGTVIVDETFSVADESGELVMIDEETTVLTPEESEPAGTADGGGDAA
jgi:hypothetical protein